MKSKPTIDSQYLDGQTLYIDPEETLTDVRQRLERVSTRRVNLIVPPRTSLRGHVIWKLLHLRAQELGKDVCIVSSDPQICALARSVQFKVASQNKSA